MWGKSEQQAFLALVRAGLWADVESANLLNQGLLEDVDWEKIYQLAEEQSVVGLVTAGVERFKIHDSSFNTPQEILLQMIGEVHMLEQRNNAMNSFIEEKYGHLQRQGIYSILVKGQGIAQCYEKPLWRSAGDIDLLLSKENYEKAKEYMNSTGNIIVEENLYKRRIEYTVDGWDVELHGTMRGGLFKKIDKVIDDVQGDIFYGGNVRSCQFGRTTVFLPSPDNDVILVFTHILQHFFRGGIGLRQICDWCRLLWTYKDALNHGLLEKRIQKMGVMSEWNAFAALAVDYLGMPVEVMPMYSSDLVWKRKAKRIISNIIKMGNFGHNKDRSYLTRHNVLVGKFITVCQRIKECIPIVGIFPIDAVKTLCSYFVRGTEQFVIESFHAKNK